MVRLRSALAAAAVLVSALARGDTVFTYDEAGNLLSVSNPELDPEACGNPPMVCPGDPHGAAFCAGGGCGLQCNPGWTDVGGRCADTSSDPTACGADFAFCPVPEHGAARCTAGVCGASCDAGYVPSGSRCVSLTSDPLNCGSLGKKCSSVPGYVTCCSASVCGVSDGSVCVNVTTDRFNCGWIGHVCAPVAGGAASCSKGRCAKAAGTPRVDRVNGVAPSGQVFRSPFWSGLTLSGAKLDLVTWVELEDWGADTVDGTAGGVRSVPVARQVTLPTGSGGPTIHFAQSASTLTMDAASLEFQGAFDPRFETRHWLKVRVHYTASGVDRSILVDVALSLTDLVPQGLPPPTITSVASYETWAGNYDPATGLLSLSGAATNRWTVPPSSVMSPDLQREFPVLRVAPEGLYLARGLNARQIGTTWAGSSILALVVFPHEPAVAGALMVDSTGLILRGADLWDDGPLQLTDASGDVLGEIPGALFTGDRVVTSAPLPVDTRHANVQLASMRGIARTPWMLEFAGTPTVSRIAWNGFEVDVGDDPNVDAVLPVGEVMTLTGTWLGNIDVINFVGPTATWIPCGPGQTEQVYGTEPVQRLTVPPGEPSGTLSGPGFRVLDDRHILLRIDAHPTDQVLRGPVAEYCDCDRYCSGPGVVNLRGREFHLYDSALHRSTSFSMQPAGPPVRVMAVGCPPGPLDDNSAPELPIDEGGGVAPQQPGPGDCSNSECG